MFCIEIEDRVKFKVRGSFNSADGTAKPFDFDVVATRLDVDAYKSAVSDTDATMADFLASVVIDWSGVRDGAGKPVDYSEDALRKVCQLPGMASLIFRTYGTEVGAKEKN